jgi:hypothetical protein
MKDIITIRGERELWLEFIHKIKKEKKRTWDILSTFLKKYVSADEETRVLLILLPNDLVEQVMAEEDPDEFIEEAIKHHLLENR